MFATAPQQGSRCYQGVSGIWRCARVCCSEFGITAAPFALATPTIHQRLSPIRRFCLFHSFILVPAVSCCRLVDATCAQHASEHVIGFSPSVAFLRQKTNVRNKRNIKHLKREVANAVCLFFCVCMCVACWQNMQGKTRMIASGLRAFYSLEEMHGRRVIVLANLRTRSMGGFKSEGMVSRFNRTPKKATTSPVAFPILFI